MTVQRRLLIALLSLVAVAPVWAQTYPSRPITMIIPFPAGGSTDVVGRIVAEGLSRELGQAVVVDNRGGAGGAIGAEAIAKARPDGYTVGLATVSTHVVNPVVRSNLPYDPLRDFTHITNLAAVPNVVVVHPSVPAQDIGSFVQLLRGRPGRFNFASPGQGSLGHMMGETFKYNAKVSLVHIPYRGAGPALNDTLGGQIEVLFDNLPSSLPHVQSGKLRALAVASPERVSALPNVPTFAEAGLPLVNDPAWFGLIGPTGMPADVVQRLYAATVKVLNTPEIRGRLTELSALPLGNTPDAFRQQISDGIERNQRVVREAGLRFD